MIGVLKRFPFPLFTVLTCSLYFVTIYSSAFTTASYKFFLYLLVGKLCINLL